MDNGEQIHHVLVEAQPPVDEEQGWAGVQTRAVRARRRHRATRGLAAVTAVAVVVGLGVGLRSWLSGNPDVAAPSDEPAWAAPDPPSGAASGLSIDWIPPGFSYEITEGTADLARTSVFHRFTSSDGTGFAIGRHRKEVPLSVEGEVVTMDGREFTIAEYSVGGTRVFYVTDEGIRVDVVSHELDANTLLQIAKGVTYNPARDMPYDPVSDPEDEWSPPDMSSAWASGLSIELVPPGFVFKENTGTADLARSAVFHTFVSSDGTEFLVGRMKEPPPREGEVVTVDGREFAIVEGSREIRVVVDAGGGVRIDVVSHELDADTLLDIAKRVTYDPAKDGEVGIRVVESGIEFRNSRGSAIECSPSPNSPVQGFTEGATLTPSVVLEPNQTRTVRPVFVEGTGGEVSFGIECVDVPTGDRVYADGIHITVPPGG